MAIAAETSRAEVGLAVRRCPHTNSSVRRRAVLYCGRWRSAVSGGGRRVTGRDRCTDRRMFADGQACVAYGVQTRCGGQLECWKGQGLRPILDCPIPEMTPVVLESLSSAGLLSGGEHRVVDVIAVNESHLHGLADPYVIGGSQPTTFDVNRSPRCSSSSTIAIA